MEPSLRRYTCSHALVAGSLCVCAAFLGFSFDDGAKLLRFRNHLIQDCIAMPVRQLQLPARSRLKPHNEWRGARFAAQLQAD